jgi:hypothetical protein
MYSRERASTVDETGEPDSASVSWGELFVRPAMWIDLGLTGEV